MTVLQNRIISILIGGLGIGVWWLAAAFPTLDDGHPGPALFPRLIAGGLVISAVALLFVSGERRTRSEGQADRTGWLRLLLGILLVVAFPWMRQYIGFIASLSLLGLAVAVVLKARIVVALPVVLVSAFLIYGLFTRLLGVPL